MTQLPKTATKGWGAVYYIRDSNVFYFEGNYAEYEENRKKRLGDNEPRRIKYKKLAI